MEDEELVKLLQEAIHKKDNEEEIRQIFEDYHPHDIAEAFEELNEQERQTLYDIIGEEKLADVFEYLDEEDTAEYIQEMGYQQGADVLNEMEVDDAADVINVMEEQSEDSADPYLEQMDEDVVETLNYLSAHDEDTAGAIMSTNFIKIKEGIDVKEATKILGYEANDAEVIDPLFVCDDDDKLVGIVALQDLIIARAGTKVDSIMETNFVVGEVTEDTISITNKINNYDIFALPIVDDGKLVGIVTMDDALDVATEAINEDYSKLASVSEEAVDVDTPIWKNVLQRLPWLIALLVLSLFISNITEQFGEVIQKVTILWFFNTMILDMAGNAGTQTLAVAVRHLGRKDLENAKDVIVYILREFLVTVLNSLVLGLISFGICVAFIYILKYNQDVNVIPTALVISVSLALSLMVTGILGAIVPIIMDKLHVDPAVASGPLITTVNDVVAMVIYFGLATIFISSILK